MSKSFYIYVIIALFSYSLNSQNHSLNFDGTDDHVKIISSPELTPTDQITIEAWVKVKPDGTRHPIVGKYDTYIFEPSYALIVEPDNRIRFGVYKSVGEYRTLDTDNAVILADRWQHVATTFDVATQEIKIYVDGNEVQSSLAPGSTTINPILAGTVPLRIGKITLGDGDFLHFNGNIDEVRLWNIVRDSEDINNTMNTELVGDEAGLISYLKMDIDGQSCDVFDCNMNENHGTREGPMGINDTPQYSDDTPPIDDVACGVSLEDCVLTSINNSTTVSNGIELYPNPFESNLFLKFSESQPRGSIKTVRLLSVEGKVVREENFNTAIQSPYELENVVSPTGIYVLQVITGVSVTSIRVVKRR